MRCAFPRFLMNRLSFLRCVAVGSLLAGVAAHATPYGLFRVHLEAGPSLWFRTRVIYGANPAVNPALAAKTDRFYDDGYNRVDASGNLGDSGVGPLASRTGYFGFINDNQVDLRAGTLALHRTGLGEGIYRSVDDGVKRPSWHVNLRISLGDVTPDRRDWGGEVGLEWARFSDSATGPVAANLQVTTDSYPLGGVVPQRAPYSGRYSPLPGDQRIGDVPTRSASSVAGTLNGRQSFNASTTVVRFGGWWELSRSSVVEPEDEEQRWSVFLRGGPALVITRARFAVDETPAAPGLAAGPRVVASASRRDRDWGWYLGAQARRNFTERFSLLAGGDFLKGPRVTVSQGERFARLDLGRAFILRLSLEYAFDRRDEKEQKP